jgi:ribose 5-phosphate isomerase B
MAHLRFGLTHGHSGKEEKLMKIAIGSDERTHLTDVVIEAVRTQGHDIQLFGPLIGEEAYWPAVAQQVAESVMFGGSDEGILFCWTGTGISLAANKVPGIRAALCADAQTAKGARLWNKANVLCLSLRATAEVVAQEILDAWFATKYQPNDVDDNCLAQVTALEEKYCLKQ